MYKAKLHNPVHNIELIVDNVQGIQINYLNGLVYCTGNASPITFFSIDKQHDVKVNVNKLRSKKKIVSIPSDLKLSSSGNLMDCKKRLTAHQNCIQQVYSEKNWNQNSLNFENEGNQLTFDSLAIVDENLFYAACPSRRTIERFVTFKDSVGIQASVATLLIYQNSFKHVSSVILVKNELAILHDKGAQLFNLETHVSQEIVTNMSPLYGCPYFCLLVKVSPRFFGGGNLKLSPSLVEIRKEVETEQQFT